MEYTPFTQQFGNLLDYAMQQRNPTAQQAAFQQGVRDGLRQGLLGESQQVLAEAAANPPQSGRDVVDQATLRNAKDTATTYMAQKQAASDIQQAANNATQAGTNAAQLATGLLSDPAAVQTGMSVGQEIFRNDYANAIEKYKNDYAWANAHGDTDGMKAASEKAAYLRQQAPSLGLDPKDLGENLDLAQMQAQGQVQRMSLLNRVLNNTPTPDEYYQQQYNKYRDSGVSSRNARSLARDDAANYQAHYMADMARSFYATGLTPENAISQTGAQILQLMRDVDPDAIALPNAYFAKPVNDYTYLRGEEARDAALARQKNWGAYNEGLQKDMLDAKTDSQSRLLGEQFEQNYQLQKYKLDFEKWKAQLAGDIQREAMAAGGGNGGGGKAPSERVQTLMQNANDIYQESSQRLDNVGDAIAALESIAQKLPDDEVRQRIKDMEYALNARREFVSWNDHGRKGSADNAINYYNAVSDENKDLLADLAGLYSVASHS